MTRAYVHKTTRPTVVAVPASQLNPKSDHHDARTWTIFSELSIIRGIGTFAKCATASRRELLKRYADSLDLRGCDPLRGWSPAQQAELRDAVKAALETC